MTAEPAAERTGSPRVEELVAIARRKLSGNELPPALTLRRYAALWVAADNYKLLHEILASDAYSTVPQAYQEDYGIDAHADSDTVQKVLSNSRQKMQQMGEKFHSAAHTFWDALCFYREHESSLPASLNTRYPLSLLRQWNFDLHELAELLCPKSFKLHPKPLPKSPQQPAPKPLTKRQVCLIWWQYLSRHRGRWSHMANVAHVWGITESTSPDVFQRLVIAVRQKHSRCGKNSYSFPDPRSFLDPADWVLFPKP
jgi:hypothetical protein